MCKGINKLFLCTLMFFIFIFIFIFSCVSADGRTLLPPSLISDFNKVNAK